MDHYSIFEQGADVRAPSEPPYFSAEDGGKSPVILAERDLEAALQLLAERARYLTGASGVSIGLRSGMAFFCRASAGTSALELGSRFRVNSGLMAESLRLRQIRLYDDAAHDGESWRELGIRSVMVGPLLRQGETVGVFELVAERVHAFEERDIATLERLSEMILTALEHFDSARCPLAEANGSKAQEAPKDETRDGVVVSPPQRTAISVIPAFAGPHPQGAATAKIDPPVPEPSTVFKVQRCQACGFPVSESRTLCLDCEEAHSSEPTLAILGQLSTANEPGWLQSHLYTMGTLFIAALTFALLVLKLR